MTGDAAPAGRLVVCPTPIGNLGDLTLRALQTLRAADVVACEDTRHTRTLLARHGVCARTVSFHEHNERERAGELVRQIAGGALVALVSDAGTPLISDPGFALLRACRQAGLPVEVLPGASAVTTALVASGLASERWCFVGFLPRGRAQLSQLLASATGTLVAFESPRRLAATLALVAERDPERPAAVCRELSKLHEEVRCASARELAEHYAGAPARGEVVLVLGPAPTKATTDRDGAAALAALRAVVDAGAKARPAAAAVAKLTGRSANELYRELTSRGQ